MAVLDVVTYGDPVLREKTKALRRADRDVLALLDDMLETVREAPGVGLAATQVGRSIRVAVVLYEDQELRLVNPKIVERRGEVEGLEGCLSLPTLQGVVIRPEAVVVQALTERMRSRKIKAEGFLARILCHEIDHLDGRLFIDRADPYSLHWIVPDEEAEEGYRREPTTLEQVLEAFEKMRAEGRRFPRAASEPKLTI